MSQADFLAPLGLLDPKGRVKADPKTGQTAHPRIFAAGDCVAGQGGDDATVVAVVAAAKRAAATIDQMLKSSPRAAASAAAAR